MTVNDYDSIGDEYDLISETNMLPVAEPSDNDSVGTTNDKISQNSTSLDDYIPVISGSELDVGMYFVESEASSSHSSVNSFPLAREDYGGVYATGSIYSIELQTFNS